MIQDTSEYDNAAWNERITLAINLAAEQILALPAELRPRALAMLAASFDRQLKPLSYSRWSGNRLSHNVRYGER